MFEIDNYILLLMSGLTALTVIGRYTANVYDNYFAKVQRFSVKPLSFSELFAKIARTATVIVAYLSTKQCFGCLSTPSHILW